MIRGSSVGGRQPGADPVWPVGPENKGLPLGCGGRGRSRFPVVVYVLLPADGEREVDQRPVPFDSASGADLIVGSAGFVFHLLVILFDPVSQAVEPDDLGGRRRRVLTGSWSHGDSVPPSASQNLLDHNQPAAVGCSNHGGAGVWCR